MYRTSYFTRFYEVTNGDSAEELGNVEREKRKQQCVEKTHTVFCTEHRVIEIRVMHRRAKYYIQFDGLNQLNKRRKLLIKYV